MSIPILLLHLPNCRTAPLTAKLIRKIAAELNISIEMQVNELKLFAEVKQYPFPGSPTVLINGVDMEPAARRVDYIGTA